MVTPGTLNEKENYGRRTKRGVEWWKRNEESKKLMLQERWMVRGEYFLHPNYFTILIHFPTYEAMGSTHLQTRILKSYLNPNPYKGSTKMHCTHTHRERERERELGLGSVLETQIPFSRCRMRRAPSRGEPFGKPPLPSTKPTMLPMV